MLDEFQKMYSEDNSFSRKLERLESELAFLSDNDQKLVLSYRIALDTGAKLPSNSEQDVNRMLTLLVNTSHVVTGQEAPISLVKVVTDLRKAQLMLSPTELNLLNALEPRIRTRQPFSIQETEALFKIYSAKGF